MTVITNTSLLEEPVLRALATCDLPEATKNFASCFTDFFGCYKVCQNRVSKTINNLELFENLGVKLIHEFRKWRHFRFFTCQGIKYIFIRTSCNQILFYLVTGNKAREFDPYHPHYLKQTPISHSIHLISRDLKIKDEKKARELLRQERCTTLSRSLSAPVDHPRNGYTLKQHQIRSKIEIFDQKLQVRAYVSI